jgi:plastocyanin
MVFPMTVSSPGLVLALASAILLAACGDGPTENDETPPSSVSVSVGNIWFQSIRNQTMDPAVDTVAAGGSVTWTWAEPGSHSVRFDPPTSVESPVQEESGSVFSHAFEVPGTYTYDCGIHGSGMIGTVVVR